MGKLYDAAKRGDVARVTALLDRGADPNESGDEHGTTALTIAAFLGHLDVVRALLARGADVDRPNKFGSRPIFTAVTNAKLRVIGALLDAGASLSVEADDGLTPVMEAARSTPETLRLLIERGADVNGVSSKGYTALQCAALNDAHGPENLRLLLHAGADPSTRNTKGQTARDLALERGRGANAAILDAFVGDVAPARRGEP
jgi:ankyrin repeat protein